MTDLNKEAEEYAKNKSSANVFQKAHIKDFIAGANSKFAKEQILLSQIELLNDIIKNNGGNYIITLLRNLEDQLKQLQDE